MTNEQLIETIKALRAAGATRIEVKADGSVSAEFVAQTAPVYVPQVVFVPIVQPNYFWPVQQPFFSAGGDAYCPAGQHTSGCVDAILADDNGALVARLSTGDLVESSDYGCTWKHRGTQQ